MVLHDQYTNSAYNAYVGNINALGDTTNTSLSVALLTVDHTVDLDGNESWADVSADDIANTSKNSDGYSAGGQELTNHTWTAGTNSVLFDADDVTWSNSTLSAGYAVVYDSTSSTDADNKLLQLVDFEGEETSENGDFTISWDSAGIFEHTPRP